MEDDSRNDIDDEAKAGNLFDDYSDQDSILKHSEHAYNKMNLREREIREMQMQK